MTWMPSLICTARRSCPSKTLMTSASMRLSPDRLWKKTQKKVTETTLLTMMSPLNLHMMPEGDVDHFCGSPCVLSLSAPSLTPWSIIIFFKLTLFYQYQLLLITLDFYNFQQKFNSQLQQQRPSRRVPDWVRRRSHDPERNVGIQRKILLEDQPARSGISKFWWRHTSLILSKTIEDFSYFSRWL